jgi:hypothetical protein
MKKIIAGILIIVLLFFYGIDWFFTDADDIVKKTFVVVSKFIIVVFSIAVGFALIIGGSDEKE